MYSDLFFLMLDDDSLTFSNELSFSQLLSKMAAFSCSHVCNQLWRHYFVVAGKCFLSSG